MGILILEILIGRSVAYQSNVYFSFCVLDDVQYGALITILSKGHNHFHHLYAFFIIIFFLFHRSMIVYPINFGRDFSRRSSFVFYGKLPTALRLYTSRDIYRYVYILYPNVK